VCVLVALFGTAFGAAAWRWASAPRAWRPNEAPVAFWAWRAETPSETDVARAARETGARELFLRAGQFDAAAGGHVKRIRAVEGAMPRGVELHLVYNATRSLLAEFERMDEKILAVTIVETFREDQERAGKDGANVRGLQLDFDSPTRLLARYARLLRATREQLPPYMKLSVTGLPTWMSAPELKDVLAEVDFWAPQFYGAEIPARLEQLTPISSPRLVARDVARARALGAPFYAGLAAYGYALLYSERGELVALRGDLDLERVARSRDFELVERRAFEQSANDKADGRAPQASEWRYVYRALADTAADGLTVHAGERLVFDAPSSESLRAAVRNVREQAGDKLCGILLFRLPTWGDATTLNLRQIAAALSDRETGVEFDLRAAREKPDADGAQSSINHLSLRATNRGEARSLVGEGALVLEISAPSRGVRGVVSLDGFDSIETLCAGVGNAAQPRPCGMRRANVLRLKALSWDVGEGVGATISFEGEAPPALAARVVFRMDDGRVVEREQLIHVSEGDGR
jgi:hypothetical protein